MNKLLIVAITVFTLSSCQSKKLIDVHACPIWADSIHNPDNEDFVLEVAFNEGVDPSQVTQEMFNKRYNNK